MKDIIETIRMLMIVLLLLVSVLVYITVNLHNEERAMIAVVEEKPIINDCHIDGNVCLRKVFEVRELQKQLDALTLKLESCKKGEL